MQFSDFTQHYAGCWAIMNGVKALSDNIFKGCKSSTMEPLRDLFLNLRYFKFGNFQVSPTIIFVTSLVFLQEL